MSSHAILVGAGTYGQVYAAYLRKLYDIIQFVDDDPELLGSLVDGICVIGAVSDLEKVDNRSSIDVFVPIGNNRARCRILDLCRSLGFITPSYIHPSVIVHDSVRLDGTVYILPSSSIMPHVSIGDGVMISMGVNVAHHSNLGDGCFLSQGSNVGASIRVGEKAFVGMSAVLMTGVRNIGARTIIGAAAVVIRDVPAGATVVGNPARVLNR